MLDFNRTNVSTSPLSVAINELIELAEWPDVNTRQYLGASTIGSECLRRVQFDWMVDAIFMVQTRDIFARGHFFEDVTRQRMIQAGFRFAPTDTLAFNAAGGLFRGHADGIITNGPNLPGVGYPCLWEHKALGAKRWRAIERDGLERFRPEYAAQIWIYQAYLDITEHPALFTALNADTCERFHLLLPFNAERAQEWSDRAVAIIRATQVGELLPRVTNDPNDWRCKMCGHRERCWR
jgi:hypothetical protein